jgi:methionine synthase I (cobalamin-dependent)
MGPTGKMIAAGEVSEADVSDAFRIQAEALATGGADALLFETFSDVEEARLAVRAAKATGLPIVVSFAFDSGKKKDRTMMGSTPEVVGHAVAEEGADAVGANCGAGPEVFAEVCRRLKAASGLPVWIKPNAGLPEMEGGRAVYRMTPEAFASFLPGLVEAGAAFVGGCCGTGPDFIRALAGVAR